MTIYAHSTAPLPWSKHGGFTTIPNAVNYSDYDLVKAVLNGSKENLATLYERHYPWVYRFLLAHMKDPADAEDVAQDVFLRMLDKLTTFHVDKGNFVAWLFRITQNIMTDFFRSRSRTLQIIEAETERLNQTTDVETALEQEALYTQISEHVKQLAPAQQQVIVLRFIAGLSVKETAMICGKAEGTVKALQSQALQKLRQLAER